MAYQASMNGGFRFRTPEGVFHSLGEFGNDIATLGELQAKLAAIDLKDSAARAAVPSVTLVVSAAILLATLPILIFGLATVLAPMLSLSPGVSLLLTGGVILVVSAIVAAVAARRFLQSFESFRRSREELARNVAWLRTIMVQSTQSSAHRR